MNNMIMGMKLNETEQVSGGRFSTRQFGIAVSGAGFGISTIGFGIALATIGGPVTFGAAVLGGIGLMFSSAGLGMALLPV